MYRVELTCDNFSFFSSDEIDAALDLSHTQNIGVMLKTHFKNSQVCLGCGKTHTVSCSGICKRLSGTLHIPLTDLEECGVWGDTYDVVQWNIQTTFWHPAHTFEGLRTWKSVGCGNTHTTSCSGIYESLSGTLHIPLKDLEVCRVWEYTRRRAVEHTKDFLAPCTYV